MGCEELPTACSHPPAVTIGGCNGVDTLCPPIRGRGAEACTDPDTGPANGYNIPEPPPTSFRLNNDPPSSAFCGQDAEPRKVGPLVDPISKAVFRKLSATGIFSASASAIPSAE